MTGAGHREAGGGTGVVVATRNRREALLRTLARLEALPERPPTVVVDNASTDGTAEAVAAAFPGVELVALPVNRGAAARNVGVERIGTPVVAFCDDDSWWEPGSLSRAARIFASFGSLGLLAGRILVGEERRLDPTSAQMRGAPARGLPGPRVHGFLACAAVVRRAAFLEAGGFCERFLIGGEERLLTIDMQACGWELCYAEDMVAIHAPDGHERPGRSWRSRRNDLWTSWLRAPAALALQDTAGIAREALADPIARRALLAALSGLPWAVVHRRPPT